MSNESLLNAELLVEKLSTLGAITSKRMFGGHGIFYNAKMFAMVDSKGVCYFKVDDRLQKEFAQLGSKPNARMPYASIPKGVFNDLDQLHNWAQKSIAYMLVKTTKK